MLMHDITPIKQYNPYIHRTAMYCE
jgi:hypothetical protein